MFDVQWNGENFSLFREIPFLSTMLVPTVTSASLVKSLLGELAIGDLSDPDWDGRECPDK